VFEIGAEFPLGEKDVRIIARDADTSIRTSRVNAMVRSLPFNVQKVRALLYTD
jgi:hypothetical protein